MGNSSLISNRLQEVLLDGKWIANTNFKEQIESLNVNQATMKLRDLNTIAALTFHINYYLDGLLRAFKTGKLEISDKFSFDVPDPLSNSDWEDLKRRFIDNSNAFVEFVKTLSDEELNAPFIDPKYGTCLRNIEGVIEHSYYHLGQVVLIRRMVSSKE